MNRWRRALAKLLGIDVASQLNEREAVRRLAAKWAAVDDEAVQQQLAEVYMARITAAVHEGWRAHTGPPVGGPVGAIPVYMAPLIPEGSWLNDDRHEEAELFRKVYAYASGKQRAIIPLSKLEPEDAYWLFRIFQHGRDWYERQGEP